MRELRHRLRFAAGPGGEPLFFRKARADYLERDDPVERRFVRLVNCGHAARAKRLEDLVTADGGAGATVMVREARRSGRR